MVSKEKAQNLVEEPPKRQHWQRYKVKKPKT